jgi:MFS family permease
VELSLSLSLYLLPHYNSVLCPRADLSKALSHKVLQFLSDSASSTEIFATYFRSYGFPNNLETYGLISGLWTSTFALGAFVGPSIAGILYDSVGFRNGTMFVVLLNVIVVSGSTPDRLHEPQSASELGVTYPRAFHTPSHREIHTVFAVVVGWGVGGKQDEEQSQAY